MRSIKHLFTILFLIYGAFFLSFSSDALAVPTAESTSITKVDQAIWDAIQREVASRPEVFLFHAYDWELSSVTYSPDQSQAVVWLNPLDPDTGMIIATEPMVVIAELALSGSSSDSSNWQVVFRGDGGWAGKANNVSYMLPQELVIDQDKTLEAPQATLAALGGYKLPWAAGLTKNLTWSAEHTSCGEGYCIYAFDFSDGTMFPLLAAKGGIVFYAKDSCANGVTDCTNMIILKDVSTSPTSFQIYYHLANNTIPAALHNVGAVVSQGQYIGNVDDTGYSSANHLHFMVHTNSYGYWGVSVDITFRDVSINWDSTTQGGRPRTEAGTEILGGDWRTSYTSGNVGTNPPTGGLTLPYDKVTVSTQTIATSGWGTDDISVTRLQLLAYYDDSWHEVGAPQTANPFNYNLDLCSAGIPVGPFDLALRVWDYEGNQSLDPLGSRHLVKTINCSAQTSPVCIPDSEQVALYANRNFSGTCRLLGIGNHDTDQLSPVSTDDVESLILGDDVQIGLFDGSLSEPGRRITLTNTDRDLGDSPLGNDHLSSATVQYRTFTPLVALDETDPHGPSSVGPTAVDSITLAWRSDYSTKFQAKIFSGILDTSDDCGDPSPLIVREPVWSISPTWSIGTLPSGNYTWCVQGRITDKNNTQYYSDWMMKAFEVTDASLSVIATRTLPYFYDVESGTGDWTGSGLWRRIADSWNANNDLWVCNNTDGDYGDPTYGGGELTSPPIQIPTGGATLRFRYRYETESDQVFWDQRWVQISENGGRFKNLVQLSDDGMNTWLTGPAIDLADYAGSIVRIRFHFSIADKYYNGGLEGWLVDDISVTASSLQGCEESSNDTLATASVINLGDDKIAEICPAGDVDYYRFSTDEGDRLIASVDALQLPSPSSLDSHLTFLDLNKYGNSLIDSNNDIQPGVMTDSQLYY